MTYKIIDLKTGFLLVNNFIRHNLCYIEQSYCSRDKPNFTKQINYTDREYAPKVFKYVECNSVVDFRNSIPENLTMQEFELKYNYSLVEIIDLTNISSQDILSDYDYKDFLIKMNHYYIL